MAVENFLHRNHKANPRKWPTGSINYNNPSIEKIWHKIPNSQVMLSQPEKLFIQDVPRHLGTGNYANLGHANGGSAVLLASGLREQKLKGKIYTIDCTWGKNSTKLIEKFNLWDYIEKCKGSTDEWAKKLTPLSFNFVFIDADHCYEAVIKDLLNWSPMIKVNGWVALHDTNQDFSHAAINTVMNNNKNWTERKEFHIHRIRTFEKIN